MWYVEMIVPFFFVCIFSFFCIVVVRVSSLIVCLSAPQRCHIHNLQHRVTTGGHRHKTLLPNLHTHGRVRANGNLSMYNILMRTYIHTYIYMVLIYLFILFFLLLFFSCTLNTFHSTYVYNSGIFGTRG